MSGGRPRRRCVQPADGPGVRRRRCPTGVEQVNPLEYRDPRSAAPTAVCSSSVRRRPASSWPRRSNGRGGRSRCRSASTCGCRARTGAATSSTGWRRSVGSTSATTRSRTSHKARKGASPQLVGTPGTADAGPEPPRRDRVSQLRGRLGSDPRRRRDVLGWAAQPLRAGRPEARPTARRHRRVDHRRPGSTARSATRSGSSRPHVAQGAPLTLDLSRGEIRRSSGRPGSDPTCRGSSCRCSTPPGGCRHDGGVVDAPGVYILGSTFLRRRRSSFIHGRRGTTTRRTWPITSSASDLTAQAACLRSALRADVAEQLDLPAQRQTVAARARAASSVARATNSSSPMLWIAS